VENRFSEPLVQKNTLLRTHLRELGIGRRVAWTRETTGSAPTGLQSARTVSAAQGDVHLLAQREPDLPGRNARFESLLSGTPGQV